MKRRAIKWVAVGGLAGLLQVGGAFADSPRNPSTETAPETMGSSKTAADPVAPVPTASPTLGDPTWTAVKLHRMNQAEIQAGTIARDNGESPKVKRFAAEIVRDHDRADRRLMAYAKLQKIDLGGNPMGAAVNNETEPDPKDADDIEMTAMIKQLKSVTGAELDRAFVSTMLVGHEKAMDLLHNTRAAAKDRRLVSILDEMKPVLARHHRMAVSLNAAMSGTASAEPVSR